MSFKVRVVPSGHEFRVEEGESILAAALRQGLAFPYSCRNGTCGSCKGKVVEGSVDYGDASAQTLPAHERQSGLALFCQAKALSDLVLEVREVDVGGEIPPRRLPTRVAGKEMLAHDVARVYLKLPAGERLQFLAGQYIDILLRDGRRRSFSLANAPHDDEHIELHIRHVEGGEFTYYVLHELKERDILRIEGPFGQFFLREDSPRPIIFMAGGTGFAPIKGIIEHAFAAGVTRPMHLYWGARAQRDLYLNELPLHWAREHDNFTYTPVLSSPLEEDRWKGRQGFVHEAIVADHPDLSGYDIYASGPPVMVRTGQEAFVAQGLAPEHFYSDPFELAADTLAKQKQAQP